MNTLTKKIIAVTGVLAAALAPIAAQAAPQPGMNVNQRLHRQQRRIENGIRTGQLTPGEAFRLERRDARIRRQEAADRRHDHGLLTVGERRRLEREENRSSSAIYRDKHNQARF